MAQDKSDPYAQVGSAALASIIQNMYNEKLQREQAMQNAMANQSAQAGQYGQNQQQMLQQLLGSYQTALR